MDAKQLRVEIEKLTAELNNANLAYLKIVNKLSLAEYQLEQLQNPGVKPHETPESWPGNVTPCIPGQQGD